MLRLLLLLLTLPAQLPHALVSWHGVQLDKLDARL